MQSSAQLGAGANHMNWKNQHPSLSGQVQNCGLTKGKRDLMSFGLLRQADHVDHQQHLAHDPGDAAGIQ